MLEVFGEKNCNTVEYLIFGLKVKIIIFELFISAA
jgi:hypothetical protein